MKNLFTIFILISTISFTSAQQVGIGTNSPDSSAILDIVSIEGGLLIPRMTSSERMLISNPANGLMIYDITTNSFWFYNGSNWENVKNSSTENIPFYTRIDFDTINSPLNGQMVYVIENDVTVMWNGSNWIVLSDDCFPQPTISIAGTNQYIYTSDTTTTLSANTPIEGIGTWTDMGGLGSFSNINDPNATYTSNSCSYQFLKWTIASDCGMSEDSIFVRFIEYPTAADAGPDIYAPDSTTITLNANTPTAGSGSWSIISGSGGSLSDPNNPNSTFTGSNDTYTLSWTTDACISDSDFITIYMGITIGQHLHGGIIAYIDTTGLHGLVVADTTQGYQTWGCHGTNIPTSQSIGSGISNTSNIISYCSTTNIAAYVCDNLTLNGYSDWYLPSISELNGIMNNIYDINNALLNFSGAPIYGLHWSSSQSFTSSAYIINFSNGAVSSYTKNGFRNTRAIRYF